MIAIIIIQSILLGASGITAMFLLARGKKNGK